MTLADAARPDQPLVLVNDAFTALTGYPREQAIGSNCRFLQGDDGETPGRQEIRRAIAQQRDTQVLLRNYKADRTPFDNLLALYALKDARGLPQYFLGTQFALKGPRFDAELDAHTREIDGGIARILSDTHLVQIKTRQLLSQSAVGVIRARLGAPARPAR